MLREDCPKSSTPPPKNNYTQHVENEMLTKVDYYQLLCQKHSQLLYPITADTQHNLLNFLSHLCYLAHDLGRRLEAELMTSSVYEGVQGLPLRLAVKMKRKK